MDASERSAAGQSKLGDFRLTTDVAEDDDTVFNFYGGYGVMKHYALTGGYVDFGSYHFEGPDFGGYRLRPSGRARR